MADQPQVGYIQIGEEKKAGGIGEDGLLHTRPCGRI
jgi:hypothetical protein